MQPTSIRPTLSPVYLTPIAECPQLLELGPVPEELYQRAHTLATEPGTQQNDKEAAHCYALAAVLDHTKAIADLGTMYALGRGVNQNDEKAIVLLKAAAQKGDAVAKYNLGVMMATGWGIKKDVEEAARLFKSSADDGDPMALFVLGTLYETGTGVYTNVDTAIRLYDLAAKLGIEAAQSKLKHYGNYAKLVLSST